MFIGTKFCVAATSILTSAFETDIFFGTQDKWQAHTEKGWFGDKEPLCRFCHMKKEDHQGDAKMCPVSSAHLTHAIGCAHVMRPALGSSSRQVQVGVLRQQ